MEITIRQGFKKKRGEIIALMATNDIPASYLVVMDDHYHCLKAEGSGIHFVNYDVDVLVALPVIGEHYIEAGWAGDYGVVLYAYSATTDTWVYSRVGENCFRVGELSIDAAGLPIQHLPSF